MSYLKSPSNILLILFAIFLLARFSAGFSEPSSPPPGANTPAPLHVGAAGQTKTGGLILNTGGAQYGLIVDQGNVGIGTQSPTQKLDVIGYVRGATGLCIGGDCRTGWPAPGGNGTVTTLSAGTAISLSPSPITNSGTISVNIGALCIKKANSVVVETSGGTPSVCPAGKVVTGVSQGACVPEGAFTCMECSDLILTNC